MYYYFHHVKLYIYFESFQKSLFFSLFPFNCSNFWLWKAQKQPSRGVLLKRCSENMLQIYRRTVAKQLYWNHLSAWVFFCKFATYFQSTCSKNTSDGLLQKASNYRNVLMIFDRINWNINIHESIYFILISIGQIFKFTATIFIKFQKFLSAMFNKYSEILQLVMSFQSMVKWKISKYGREKPPYLDTFQAMYYLTFRTVSLTNMHGLKFSIFGY